MDRSTESGRSPAALLVFVLFASLIGAVRVWQSPAPSEAKDLASSRNEIADLAVAEVNTAHDLSYGDPGAACDIRFADRTPHIDEATVEPSAIDGRASKGLPDAFLMHNTPAVQVKAEATLSRGLTPVATTTPSPLPPNHDLHARVPAIDSVAVPAVASRAFQPELIKLLMNERIDSMEPISPPAKTNLPVRRSNQATPQRVKGVRVPAPVVSSSVATEWPVPVVLEAELESIEAAHAAEWKRQAISWLQAFKTTSGTDRKELQTAVRQLDWLSRQAEFLARKCRVPANAVALRTTGYSLSRRVQIWNALLLATSDNADLRVRKITGQDQRRVMQKGLAAALETMKKSKHFDAWSEFLSIRDLNAVTSSQVVFDPDARLAIAGHVLERMLDDELSEPQQQFLKQPGLQTLYGALTVWSTRPIEGPALLHAIEELERDPSASASQALAEHWSRLKFSTIPEHRHLAEVIDKHYRNANVRLAANEDFLNRLLPAMRNVRAPVREFILGAEVSGQSDSRTQLQVDLLPDEERIKARLNAKGELAARTQSRKGSIIFHNRNRSHFLIQKLFLLDGKSLHVGRTDATAQARTNLLGMNTQYDAFPIVGSIVRRMAIQKHIESKGLARRVLESKVEENARQRIDAQVDQQLARAQQNLQERVLDRLEGMELKPTTLALNSTNERMVMRGRLAADHQVGAFTARPRAMPNNMVEMQIHQSAFNNFLDQAQLEGRQGPLPKVFREIGADLGFGDVKVPEDVPEDVSVRLADDEPIRVDCLDDEVKLTVRIDRLWGDRLDLRDFEVSAFYVPEIDGIRCDLKRRDGGIHVSCRRTRLAVRAIFTKVFSPNRPIPMVLPELADDPRMRDLELNQLVLRDGWVGVSVVQPQHGDDFITRYHPPLAPRRGRGNVLFVAPAVLRGRILDLVLLHLGLHHLTHVKP